MFLKQNIQQYVLRVENTNVVCDVHSDVCITCTSLSYLVLAAIESLACNLLILQAKRMVEIRIHPASGDTGARVHMKTDNGESLLDHVILAGDKLSRQAEL
jgi:hypothetical protein